MEVTSTEQFSSLLAGSDLSIDSSLYYYSGDPNLRLSLHDVYRPAPYLDLRSGLGGLRSQVLSLRPEVEVESECMRGFEVVRV